MISIIKRHKKITDIFNYKESETRLSILLSVILCIVLYWMDLFEKFSLFSKMIFDIILYFIGGYVGIIGFSLTGMSLMFGLFSRKQIYMIEKYNKEGIIEDIMSSYAFLAFISAFNIFILLIISFAISSDKKILPIYLFWVCTFAILYLTCFNIFYAVSLVFNCLSLFTISKIYSGCEEKNEIVSTANELKVDYLLGVLVKALKISRKDFFEGLRDEASNLPDDMQKKVIEYLEKHYPE